MHAEEAGKRVSSERLRLHSPCGMCDGNDTTQEEHDLSEPREAPLVRAEPNSWSPNTT